MRVNKYTPYSRCITRMLRMLHLARRKSAMYVYGDTYYSLLIADAGISGFVLPERSVSFCIMDRYNGLYHTAEQAVVNKLIAIRQYIPRSISVVPLSDVNIIMMCVKDLHQLDAPNFPLRRVFRPMREFVTTKLLFNRYHDMILWESISREMMWVGMYFDIQRVIKQYMPITRQPLYINDADQSPLYRVTRVLDKHYDVPSMLCTVPFNSIMNQRIKLIIVHIDTNVPCDYTVRFCYHDAQDIYVMSQHMKISEWNALYDRHLPIDQYSEQACRVWAVSSDTHFANSMLDTGCYISWSAGGHLLYFADIEPIKRVRVDVVYENPVKN